MVVADTTWLLKNFRKLRMETSTQNILSGSGLFNRMSSASSFSSFWAISCLAEGSQKSSRQQSGPRCSPIDGLPHLTHCVSSFTVSVLIDNWRMPLLFARNASTSESGRSLSTIVRIFSRGGSKTWTWCVLAFTVNVNETSTYLWVWAPWFVEFITFGWPHHVYTYIMGNADSASWPGHPVHLEA